jgi:trimethylguanosine synthase
LETDLQGQFQFDHIHSPLSTTMDDIIMPLEDFLPLTDECRHYTDESEVPPHLQKYWHQRYSLFTWYDYDIRLTDAAWFGVTPEPVANRIAEDLPAGDRDTIVDLFAGAGGNTIAFALSGKWNRVIAVERDPAVLACAQHNADIYGVPDGAITWVLADSLEYLARLKRSKKKKPVDVDRSLHLDFSRTLLFASPPWGGVDYKDQEVFDLSTMQPYNLETLHEACRPMEHALYLPRTSDLRQIAKLVPDGGPKLEVVQYCMRGASKAMVVYVPAEGEVAGAGR